jgi:hypothetical protein
MLPLDAEKSVEHARRQFKILYRRAGAEAWLQLSCLAHEPALALAYFLESHPDTVKTAMTYEFRVEEEPSP